MCSLCVTKAFKRGVRVTSTSMHHNVTRYGRNNGMVQHLLLVPKPNGKIRLCLDPVRLNHTLIRPVYRGTTLDDIFPKVNNVKYLSLVDASSTYNNLKLDEKSSYLTTFACQFGRYRHKKLPFGAVPPCDMFQRKIDEIFKDWPNVFGNADDILVVGYDSDGKDHDDTLWKDYTYETKQR